MVTICVDHLSRVSQPHLLLALHSFAALTMPPKAAKPKTKKELKAEAEAAARAAEEERVRQEEEARRVAEQVEQRRQELLKEYTNKKDAKLGAER